MLLTTDSTVLAPSADATAAAASAAAAVACAAVMALALVGPHHAKEA